MGGKGKGREGKGFSNDPPPALSLDPAEPLDPGPGKGKFGDKSAPKGGFGKSGETGAPPIFLRGEVKGGKGSGAPMGFTPKGKGGFGPSPPVERNQALAKGLQMMGMKGQ